MTIHDEEPRHRRRRYYQGVKTPCGTCHREAIEKNPRMGYGRYQKEK